MIVNLRGTSGAGKTYLTGALRRYYPKSGGFIVREGKRVGELLASPDVKNELAIIHCDGISGYDNSFALVRAAAKRAHHVIYEGLIVSEEWKRTLQLHQDGYALVVVHLDVPLETCLAGVRARRGEVGGKGIGFFGEEKPGALNEKNTTQRVRRIASALAKLKEAGVYVVSADRVQALQVVEESLGLA